MGAKGDAARKRILDEARMLFAQKGYSEVTMKDVCEAVGMSRGGVYRHYTSTEDIFAAIICREQEQAIAALKKAEKENRPPEIILLTFLRNRANYYLHQESSFENAITEFAQNSAKGKAILVERAKTSVKIMSHLIRLGCESGAFCCGDEVAAAEHLLWLLEGMAKHNALIPIGEDEIDKLIKQFKVMLGYRG
ncbi:MAG: TetR/AcrR family transcriptional regulator [Clostridiales bacterium]|nr:TetR/AcrR family transcriptional regulator [Clostridiales bacterium]